MNDKITSIAEFLTEAERLKQVCRASYTNDASRHENSAEHSWHLAFALLTLARELDLDIDIPRALAMAIIHDVCEIDAGDTPVYSTRHDQHDAEKRCVDRFAGLGLRFGQELRDLWLEYEAQLTRESRWVKVLDRFLPFLGSLATQGKAWRELSVTRAKLLRVNEPVRLHAPEIYDWMLLRIDESVKKGWLLDR